LGPEPVELAFVGTAGGRHVIKLVRQQLEARIPGSVLHVYPDVPDLAAVRAVVGANPPIEDLEAFPNLEFVASIWAGVEHLANPERLPGVQIARYVDEALEATMTEAVMTHVLNVHRHTYHFLDLQAAKQWVQAFYDKPETLTVGVLGLGALGADSARALAEHGFTTLGWARTLKDIPGVEAFTGPADLKHMLKRCNVVVCLLPLTPETEGILNLETMGLLEPGATVINVARGGHVAEADLIELLDSGHLDMAILDVFASEPLPQDDPLWDHPKVKVFPHIAAPTDREQASTVAATAVQAFLEGTPIHGLVDRELGY
jgi:glyoxylate/hydroxypyruvate reductase A